MPVRARAKSPGEFMRDHLVDAGGVDYPQSIFRAYKEHLKASGIGSCCSRASWSAYIWRAKQLGLIEFDHAEAMSYWDGTQDGIDVGGTYAPEPRPLAPSPRHYYRIVNSSDPRWTRLEASYRLQLGYEVPPPAVKPQPRPEKPTAEKKPVAKKLEEAKVKPAAKPKAPPKEKPLTPEEKVHPFEERIGLILATVSETEASPTYESVNEIEERLMNLGEDVVAAAEQATGRERTLLNTLLIRWRAAQDTLPLLRNSVGRYLVSQTAAERVRSETALRAAVRVFREEITTIPVEEIAEEAEYREQIGEGTPITALIVKWEDRDKNVRLLEKDLNQLDPDVYDLGEIEDVISDYRGLERGDYETTADYQEARNEAWDDILDALRNLEPEEEEGEES
jgi:outer membrane biosynthesis protein TonB